ncbi:MAG: putative glycolipid-binding domain-containing protein [Acidimicrobiia bacterium]
MAHLVVWKGIDEWRSEVATVELTADGVQARGTQVGLHPLPYRLDYDLDAGDGFVTRRLRVDVAGSDWHRRVDLSRKHDGEWRCIAETHGDAPVPAAGGDPDPLIGALDCDLGLSPLTNLMPIRRHALHEGPSEVEILAAWVSVPDLAVHASAQRYEHVRRTDDGSVVRFVDLGLHRGFEAELDLDREGLVRFYPDLALRLDDRT